MESGKPTSVDQSSTKLRLYTDAYYVKHTNSNSSFIVVVFPFSLRACMSAACLHDRQHYET